VAILGIRGALLAAGLLIPLVVALRYRGFAELDARAIARVDVLELLRAVTFFRPLRVDALEGVAARLRLERHGAGMEIVHQGDVDAHRWYLVREGQLAVEVDGFLVGELRRGSQFGELSLLRGVPRAATVRALTDVELYGLSREEFVTAVAGLELNDPDSVAGAGLEQLDPATALATAPLLRAIEPAELDTLIARSRLQEVSPGTPIVVSGEQDDLYHVLVSGRARVFVDGSLRRELHPGDSFGEIAVLHRVPRTASVIASEPSIVVTLDGEAIRAVVRGSGGVLAALAS
jgi:CRP-like cAMP-binding protein